MLPAIFMHIQKTAGTTLVNLIRQHYGLENSMSHGDHLADFDESPTPKTFFRTEDIRAKHGSKLFISGHFGYNFCSAFMKDRYSFTFLRDPMERIVSCYYYFRSRPAMEYPIQALAHENSLEDFLRLGLTNSLVRLYIWNNQAWQLAHGYCNNEGMFVYEVNSKDILDMAHKHISEFSFIGTVENFYQGRNTILSSLNIPLPQIDQKENITPGRPMLEHLPESTLELLRELTQLEQPLYDSVNSKYVH